MTTLCDYRSSTTAGRRNHAKSKAILGLAYNMIMKAPEAMAAIR